MSARDFSPVATRTSLAGTLSSPFPRRGLVLAALWVTAAAAQWAALRPALTGEHTDAEVILYHFVGASFAACGLLAWHRRPEARTGSLMVATGFLFFARPC